MYLYVSIQAYLFERITEEETHRYLSSKLTLQTVQCLGLVQAKTRSQELYPSLPCGQQVSEYLDTQPLLFPDYGLDHKWSSQGMHFHPYRMLASSAAALPFIPQCQPLTYFFVIFFSGGGVEKEREKQKQEKFSHLLVCSTNAYCNKG